MKQKFNSRQRFLRMFHHREADRIPITDYPWAATLQRWLGEGMTPGMDFADFFGLDHIANIEVDISPRYPRSTLEETDEYIISTTSWGATQKYWKKETAAPRFLDATVKDRKTWQVAKERMTPAPERIDWDRLGKDYRRWRAKGWWIQAMGIFGFDVTHTRFLGTEKVLMALAEDPDWCQEIFNHELELTLALLDMIWEAGYEFDGLFFHDDLGYKHKQFFSLNTYRTLLKPIHARAIEWAHAKGIVAELHSCGNINPFVTELVEIGLDGLNPLESKAGMHPLELKQKYGERLLLHGGINSVLWGNVDAMEDEIRRLVPRLKKNGGYIFSSDHSVSPDTSLGNFRRVIELVKEVGKY